MLAVQLEGELFLAQVLNAERVCSLLAVKSFVVELVEFLSCGFVCFCFFPLSFF